MSIQAVWNKVWGRGVSISFLFDGLDGGNDKCIRCPRVRKFHRRDGDHKFVGKEGDKQNEK